MVGNGQARQSNLHSERRRTIYQIYNKPHQSPIQIKSPTVVTHPQSINLPHVPGRPSLTLHLKKRSNHLPKVTELTSNLVIRLGEHGALRET